MTPNPTDQDVAALVARLRKSIGGDVFQAGFLLDDADKFIERQQTANAAIEAFATHRDKQADLWKARAEASEARATALEGERDEAKRIELVIHSILDRAGFSEESTENQARAAINRATALEAQLARTREVLEPFAKVPKDGARSSGNADISVAWGFDGYEITVGDFRRAREVLRSPALADGRGEDDVVASARFPREPVKALVCSHADYLVSLHPPVTPEAIAELAHRVKHSGIDALTYYDWPVLVAVLENANQKITQTGDRDE